eukprot:69363-Amphidinium_carterae.1
MSTGNPRNSDHPVCRGSCRVDKRGWSATRFLTLPWRLEKKSKSKPAQRAFLLTLPLRQSIAFLTVADVTNQAIPSGQPESRCDTHLTSQTSLILFLKQEYQK